MGKSGLKRVLALLEAFADGEHLLSAEQLAVRNGLSMATCYRYIRDLCDVGLLVKLAGGYAPGPRIIEWDRMVRLHNPLLSHAQELVHKLVHSTGLEFLLSQLYGDRVINVHCEYFAPNDQLVLGRGSALPLFRGAASRVILAEMPTRHQRRLYEAHCSEPDVLAIGADWRSFSQSLAEVRKQGYALTMGEIYQERVGIAAPLFGAHNHVLGSLTLIGSQTRFRNLREEQIVAQLKAVARKISVRLAQFTITSLPITAREPMRA